MPDLIDLAQRAIEHPAAALLHEERCLAQRGLPELCTACFDACPMEAVSFDLLDAAGTHGVLGMPEPARQRIDAEACTSCGSCVAACPTGALGAMGALSDDALLDAVRHAARAVCLRSARERTASNGSTDIDQGEQEGSSHLGKPGAPHVAFVCERDAAGVDGEGASIVLPCLAWIDEALLVHAVAEGAQLVVLSACACTTCPQRHAVRELPRTAQRARRIADLWRLDGTIELIDERTDADARSGTDGGMSRRGLLSRARATIVDAATSAAALQTEAIVGKAGEAKSAEPDRRRWQLLDDLHAVGLPDGADTVPRVLAPRASIDFERCSGCAHCALFCPTGALRKSRKGPGGTTVLEFDATRCRDCGACVEVCRYGALVCDESLTVDELFAFDPCELVIPKRRVLPERRILPE